MCRDHGSEDVPGTCWEPGDGGLAQLGERLVCNQEVTGSSPVFSTSLLLVADLVSLAGWKFWTRGWCSFSVSECDAPD